VGYSGAKDPASKDPTYQRVQDFAEAIRVTYDPGLISYGNLLSMFFAFHQPGPPAFTGTQYRSAIFYHSEAQRSEAEAALKAKGRLGEFVSLEPGTSDFYRAEEYHQNYLAKAMGTPWGVSPPPPKVAS